MKAWCVGTCLSFQHPRDRGMGSCVEGQPGLHSDNNTRASTQTKRLMQHDFHRPRVRIQSCYNLCIVKLLWSLVCQNYSNRCTNPQPIYQYLHTKKHLNDIVTILWWKYRSISSHKGLSCNLGSITTQQACGGVQDDNWPLVSLHNQLLQIPPSAYFHVLKNELLFKYLQTHVQKLTSW